MQWDDIDFGVDTRRESEDELSIDFTIDQVDVRSETGSDLTTVDRLVPGETRAQIENAALDDLIDEVVDLLNARDMDGLGELLAPGAEATFLKEASRDGVVDGINDLTFRFPSLLATRGDLGTTPIVALWVFDVDTDCFDTRGYLVFNTSADDEPLIESIDYVDEFGEDDDLVLEMPERSDLPEWDEWSESNED